jgi:hypothetical protein
LFSDNPFYLWHQFNKRIDLIYIGVRYTLYMDW